tara:strand:- start:11711 stop:12937 length:1227 start_codon:yes stop_codon:yes gene_type:complete
MSNVLILGSGARESALVWKLKKSNKLKNIYLSPGNGGTIDCNVNLDFNEISKFVNNNNIDFVIPGSETYLAKGITNILEKETNTCVVGPNIFSSQLETSKSFAKNFMKENKIPTANYKEFTSLSSAKNYIKDKNVPFVIKANGLAGGKGVVVVNKKEDAVIGLESISNKFGKDCFPIIIEDFLKGIEVSMFILCDGKDYIILPEGKDYKQLLEKNRGPNTGGMGAISPSPNVSLSFVKKVEERIIKPTLRNIEFKGFLFLGLMDVDGEPFVIEYNVRLGDPESTVILPRLENDFIEILESYKTKSLSGIKVKYSSKCAATIVLASKGYPESYQKGFPIEINRKNDTMIFHAGTSFKENKLLTNGGRVLCITSLKNTIGDAINNCYDQADDIKYKNKVYRRDIGFEFIT